MFVVYWILLRQLPVKWKSYSKLVLITASLDSHSGLLTKKFINLIKHAEDGMLDLNKAADTLEVKFNLCKRCRRQYS